MRKRSWKCAKVVVKLQVAACDATKAVLEAFCAEDAAAGAAEERSRAAEAERAERHEESEVRSSQAAEESEAEQCCVCLPWEIARVLALWASLHLHGLCRLSGCSEFAVPGLSKTH